MKQFCAVLLVFAILTSFVACNNPGEGLVAESSSHLGVGQSPSSIPTSTGMVQASIGASEIPPETTVPSIPATSSPQSAVIPSTSPNTTATSSVDPNLKNLKVMVTINDELYWWGTATTYAVTVAELLDEMEDIDFISRHLTNKTIMCVKGVWAKGINHWDIYYSGEKIDSSPESVYLQTEIREFRLNLVKPKGDEKQHWLIADGTIIYFYVSDYDFGNWTPFNITLEEWNSWDAAKRSAFQIYDDKFGDSSEWTLEQRSRYLRITRYNGYDCGVEGHICFGEEAHNNLMKYIEAGCTHCGSSDCPCLLSISIYGSTWPDYTQCPQYDERNDPTVYCQDCCLILSGPAESGQECCRRTNRTVTCSWCQNTITAGECHRCTKP